MSSLFSKKFVIILLATLIGLSFCGMVAGGIYLYTSSIAPGDGEGDSEYEIRVDEYIEIFADREFRLTPVLLDRDGNETAGRFAYECNSDRITIDRDGYVTVVDNVGGEVEVKITERKTGLEKTVVLCIVSELDGVLEIRLDGERATDGTVMEIDTEYVFEVITIPSSVNVSDYLTLTVTDAAGEEKQVFDLIVEGNEIRLTPTGIGSGTLLFEMENKDRNVKFRQSVAFSLVLPDATLTNAVLAASEGTLLEREDLTTVERLIFPTEVTALSFDGVEHLTSLKAVVFQAAEQVTVEKLSLVPNATVFRVNGLELYETYAASEMWEDRKNEIYPYLEKTEGMTAEPWELPVVVYHNEESYRLLNAAGDGSLPLLEMLNGTTLIHTPSTAEVYTYISSASPRLQADMCAADYSVRSYSFDGYRFAGWVDADGAAFDNADLSALTEGIHVYARWTPDYYTVTLEDYVEGASNLRVIYGQAIGLLPTPAKNGWKFAGWYLSDAYLEAERVTEDIVYRLTEDLTLYAKYETDLTLDYHGVAESVTLQNVVYGKPLGNALPQAGQGGWSFAGWYTATTYAESARILPETAFVLEGAAPDATLSLYAMLTHTIALENYHNAIGTDAYAPITVVCRKTLQESLALTGSILPQNTEVNGWKLIGWTSQTYSNGIGFDTETLDAVQVVSGNEIFAVGTTKLYAIYESTVTIKGGVNGETALGTKKVIFGCRLTVGSYDNVAVPGYTFAGWYLNARGSALGDGALIMAGYSNATIYAMYTANRYSISFVDRNGNTLYTRDFYDVTVNDEDHILNNGAESGLNGRRIEMPYPPVRLGYTGQWYYNGQAVSLTTEDGIAVWYVPDSVFENITLTASYTANRYTVHFDDLGTGSQLSDLTVAYDSSYGALPTPKLPAGYTFDGWYADADYTTPVKADTLYTRAGDTTLYAKYSIRVVFVDYDGTENERHFVYGLPVDIQKLADEGGWHFDGWFDAEGNALAYDRVGENGNGIIESYKSSVQKYLSRWTRKITLNSNPHNGFALPEGKETLTVVRGETLSSLGLALPTDSDLVKTGDGAAWTLLRWYYLHDGEKVTATVENSQLVNLVSVDCLYAEYRCEVDIVITLPSGTTSTPTPVTLILGNSIFASLDQTYKTLFAAEQGRGYHHVGWRVGSTEYRFSESGSYQGDTVAASFGTAGEITAILEPNSYSVSYDANGGETTPKATTQIYGTAFRLPDAIERVGYRFVGWKLGDTCYEAGASVRNLAVSGGVTLVAQWELVTYTVTFTDFMGETVDERTYTVENRVFDTPEIPTRTGYLVAWAEFATKLASAAEDFEVKAEYTPIQYTVTYDLNGGEGTVEAQAVAFDNAELLVFANAVSRLGYTFEGWKYGDEIFGAGEVIPNLTAQDGESIELVAQWKVIVYPLTYVIDGKTVATSTYHVEMTSYMQPDIPLKRGFRSYWNFDSLKTLNAETVGFTVEAVYVAIPYTIKYMVDGEVYKTLTYTVETLENVEAPHEIPTKLGYVFTAWEHFDQTTLGDKTLHAIFAPIQYTLVFLDGEGMMLDSVLYTVEDASITAPAIPAREGYIGSWGIDRATLLARIEMLESGNTALEFKATYIPCVYNVTVEGVDATNHYSYTAEQLSEGTLTLILPALSEGYVYVASIPVVSYDAESRKLTLTVAELGDIAIRVLPTETNFYAITFDYGYDGMRQTLLYSEGEPVELPTLARDGYVFLGWFIGDQPVDAENLLGANRTLTAKWQAIQYTVVFKGYEESNLTLTYEQALTLITPELTGYRFLGWYLGGTRYESGMKNLTLIDGEILTLTPVWEPIRYTVRYDVAGGSNTPPAQTVLYGSTFHLPAVPSREGYIFLGWRIGETLHGAGKQLSNLTATDHACVTAVAEWQAISYTVVFDGSEQAAQVWYYDQSNALPKPTRAGYEFLGWEYLGEVYNSGYELRNLCAINGETVVFRALWKPNAYEILFQYYYLGSEETHRVTFTKNDLFVNEPLPISKDGYAVGWAPYTPESGITVLEVQLEGGKTLIYHLGEKRAYRVFASEDDLAALQSNAPALPAREGYTVAWRYVEDENGNYNAYPNYTLENSETYQLTLNPNGGVMTDPAFVFTANVAFGADYALPTADAISRFGYRFLGWSVDGELISGDTFCYLIGDDVASTVTLTALWEPIEYTIIFRGMVDTEVTYTLDMHPSEIRLPSVALIAQRSGYVGQWQLPALTGTDLTVYPVYTPVIFTVSFDLGVGVAPINPITLAYGSEFLPEHAAREGYRLVGWELDGTVFRADEPISCRFNVANGTAVTLKAVWEAERRGFTATFVSMGEVIAEVIFTQSDIERGYLISPALPAREHFEGTWEFYTLSASDLTVQAVWTPILYEIRFLSDADTAEVTDRIYAPHGTVLTMPELPEKEGYTASWEKLSDTEYKLTFTPITYKVEFTTEGGAELKPQDATYDTDLILPEAPVRRGYLFGGWQLGEEIYNAGETVRNLTATDGEVLTLTAVWTPEQYTLTLMDGDANVGSITFTVLDTLEQIRERCATYAITARAGYQNARWDIPDGFVYESQTVSPAFDLIKYHIHFLDSEGITLRIVEWTVETGAVEEPEGKFIYELRTEAFDENNNLYVKRQEVQANEQTVKFYQQKVGADQPTLIATRYFSENNRTFFISNVPHLKGYLGQWDMEGILVTVDGVAVENPKDYLTVSPTGDSVTVSEEIFALIDGKKLEISIYAVYTPITYTILYDAQGGSAVESTEITYSLAGQVIGAASERLGYHFRGWYCAVTGRTYAASSVLEDANAIAQEQGAEVVFTAVWEPIRYTVEYQMNGGSTEIENYLASYDQPFTLPAVPERLNYTFICWDINGVRYQADDELINLCAAEGESILVEAIWEIRTYTVTFLDTKGDTVGTCTYTVENKKIIEPALLQKLGYTAAWEDYSDLLANDSALSDFAVSICYTPITYRVTYDVNGGNSTPDSIEATYETVWNMADAIVREGYDFIGWRMGDRLFAAGTEISAFVTESGSYELVAEWTPTVYRVLFMAKAEGEEDNAIFAIRTYTVESPDFDMPPLPAGYLAWGMPKELTPEIAVYPVAETEDCVITFVNEQGEVVASLIATRGEALGAKLPAVPAKKGYRGEWILPETVEDDITVRPHYEVITYKAYFYDENGNLVKLTDEDGNEYEYSEYTVLDGKLITPAVPEKAHFYGAWNLPAEMVGDLEITVLYTPIMYRITYLVDGIPTFVRDYTIYYVMEGLEIADPAVPEQIGLVPMGWTAYDLTLLTDQTVEAQYVTSQYIVQYDPNGGTPTPEEKHLVYEEVFHVAEKPERTGYIFLGWKGSDGVLYEAGAEVSRLTSEHLAIFTFTAEWHEIVYRIEFTANGGNTTPESMDAVTYEQMITLPDAITRTGYIFSGWILPDGSIRQPGEQVNHLTVLDGATVFVSPQWTPITYTVQFNTGSGSAVNAITATYDQPLDLTAASTLHGYTFVGWNCGNSVEWGTVSLNLTAENGATVTVSAVFTPTVYTITYHKDGGSVPSDARTTYTIESSSYDLPTPSRDGYEFLGWYSNSEKTNSVSKIEKGTTGNLNFYAKWEKECIATGTEITLADGSTKRVEELTGEELLLVWDFATGEYVARPITLLLYHGDHEYEVTNLCFSDGSVVRIIGSHAFFDVEQNRFVYLDETNFQNYVGHRFVKMNGTESEQAYESVVLEDAYVTLEVTGAYSILTAQNINCITNGILSLTPLEDFAFFEALFAYGDQMRYDEGQMQADIEQYGLYTYEEWSEYLTYEQFVAFNGPYIKIAIGKGLATEEDLIHMIEVYLSQNALS